MITHVISTCESLSPNDRFRGVRGKPRKKSSPCVGCFHIVLENSNAFSLSSNQFVMGNSSECATENNTNRSQHKINKRPKDDTSDDQDDEEEKETARLAASQSHQKQARALHDLGDGYLREAIKNCIVDDKDGTLKPKDLPRLVIGDMHTVRFFQSQDTDQYLAVPHTK